MADFNRAGIVTSVCIPEIICLDKTVDKAPYKGHREVEWIFADLKLPKHWVVKEQRVDGCP